MVMARLGQRVEISSCQITQDAVSTNLENYLTFFFLWQGGDWYDKAVNVAQ